MTSPRTLLKAWNLRAKKQFGQHFLVDPSTAEMMVSRANIAPSDIVLEIGAGLGALTIPLARTAEKVYAVEKDHRICELLKTELLIKNISNIAIIREDILKLDFRPFAEENGRRIIVMGNLPYNISSQILVRLVRNRRFVNRAILMFQKELARRITAEPGSKDYGRLTVMLRYCTEIKRIASVDASLFFPAPQVASEVLEIKFVIEQKYPEQDEVLLFKVIKAAFGNRRKTLRNALAASELQISPQTALQALNLAGIDPRRRAETLTVHEFIALQNSLTNVLATRSKKAD
jgi:16S rRNA (adenine1518-N6/adenine1519-N6)-dimethyltransferase